MVALLRLALSASNHGPPSAVVVVEGLRLRARLRVIAIATQHRNLQPVSSTRNVFQAGGATHISCPNWDHVASSSCDPGIPLGPGGSWWAGYGVA